MQNTISSNSSYSMLPAHASKAASISLRKYRSFLSKSYSTSAINFGSSFIGSPIMDPEMNKSSVGFPSKRSDKSAHENGSGGSDGIKIEAGGGKRTFPGGVTKWQWKRSQEKKSRGIERAILNRERDELEVKRREQRRLIDGPERPWENQRVTKVPEALLAPVPSEIIDRFRKIPQEGDPRSVWNENDGPETRQLSNLNLQPNRNQPKPTAQNPKSRAAFVKPNGQVSARDWPEAPVFRPLGYEKLKTQTKPEKQPSSAVQTSSAVPSVAQSVVPSLSAVPNTQDAKISANGNLMTDVSFESLGLAPATLEALHGDLGYHFCTPVQAQAIPHILTGKDVLAKAKTGTGKTLAFLLPAIQSISATAQKFPKASRPILCIVISPTRELACQLADEARALVAHHPNIGVQVVIGGVRMASEAARLARDPCQILVGTPGRLLDHLQSTAQYKTDLRQRLQPLQTLILDEADTLLNMGFRKSLEGILAFMPPKGKRQTVMVSATLSPEVMQVAREALRDDHVFVDAVGEETTTNLQVRQEAAIVPVEKQFSALFSLLHSHAQEEPNFKVMIFSTTARQTQLLAELALQLGISALEIHSRKSQSYRTKVSDQFRTSPGKVALFTSDVSARGVDYPDVTLVIQVGVPSERAQYIHRLGRTGRAGKEGHGVLLLSPPEKFFLKELSDLPVEPCELPAFDEAFDRKVGSALARVAEDTKEKAYTAWLGFYNGVKGTRWDKPTLVQHANLYSRVLGFRAPPKIPRKTVGMMGLKNVPGLNVE